MFWFGVFDANDDLDIGARPEGGFGGQHFNGTIDNLKIYNHSLSPEQILLLNASRTDLIVSNETNDGEIWQVCMTPNDGYQDGNTTCSNNVTINLIPTAPTLLIPENASAITNRTPTFLWNNSYEHRLSNL